MSTFKQSPENAIEVREQPRERRAPVMIATSPASSPRESAPEMWPEICERRSDIMGVVRWELRKMWGRGDDEWNREAERATEGETVAYVSRAGSPATATPHVPVHCACFPALRLYVFSQFVSVPNCWPRSQ